MGRYTGDFPTESDPLVQGQETYSKNGRRKWCIVCAVVTCIVFLTGASLSYFLFPRTPDVQVYSDEIAIKQWGWNYYGVMLDADVPMSVYNPNYVPLSLSLSLCDVYYAGQKIGTGRGLSRTTFPSMATTNASIQIGMLQSMQNATILLSALVANCGYPASSSKSIRLDMQGTVKVGIVAYANSVPFSSSFNLPCA